MKEWGHVSAKWMRKTELGGWLHIILELSMIIKFQRKKHWQSWRLSRHLPPISGSVPLRWWHLKYIFKESVSNRPQAASRILRWGIFLSTFDFNIRFTNGTSPEIRQTGWLSRESYLPATDDQKKAALKLDPEERIQKEMQCPDCIPENLDRVVMNVTTHDTDFPAQTQEPASNKGPISTGHTATGVTKQAEKPHPKNTEGNEEKWIAPDPEVMRDPEYKKIANYFIPYRRIYKRLDQYRQNRYPKHDYGTNKKRMNLEDKC